MRPAASEASGVTMIGDSNNRPAGCDHKAADGLRCYGMAVVQRGIDISTGLPRTYCFLHDPDEKERKERIERIERDARRTLWPPPAR